MVLAEIYIIFNFIAFFLFLHALDNKGIFYPLFAMFMFFSLSVMGANIVGIFTGTTNNIMAAITINFSLAIVSFVYVMLSVAGSLNTIKETGYKEVEEEEDEKE